MIQVDDGVSLQSTVSREARAYGVKELARRAGVDSEFFKTWAIHHTALHTIVRLPNGNTLRFCNDHQAVAQLRDRVAAVRAKWMSEPDESTHQSIPDFIIPFVTPRETETRPIFRVVDSATVESPFDLPLITLLMLSRYEETLTTVHDKHGRYLRSLSAAARNHFEQRPILDEYGIAFEQAIRRLLPGWRPEGRKFRVKLSHDIDRIGLPFDLKAALGHTLIRHNPMLTLRDTLGKIVHLMPSYLECVNRLARLSTVYGLDSAIYWKASDRGPYDSGYDLANPRVASVMQQLSESGIEQGFHPGYDTFRSPRKLQEELERFQKATGIQHPGGRQHYLRWCPDTWLHWEQAGLSYDSSVGYADAVGFRAGTCYPYKPWLFSENRQAALVEIPLIVMECAVAYDMRLDPQNSRQLILEMASRCRTVGGVFTLLWHNDSLVNPIYGNIYSEVLNALSPAARYDVSDESQNDLAN